MTRLIEGELTDDILNAAIEIHRSLGPGLLESTYRACLAQELSLRGHRVVTEQALPLEYKGMKLSCSYRMDLVVDGRVVVEIKAAECLAPIHDAQLLTYLRLSGHRVGLLINFNVVVLRDGIRRLVN